MAQFETEKNQDGKRVAIEVVTLFEDTIVDARHFADPAAGTVRSSTRALLWGGAGSLAAALAIFVVAYMKVAHEKAAGDAIPSHGSAIDVLAVLLVAGGLAAIVRGLLRLHDERRPRHFTAGSDPAALFHSADATLPAASFPLLHSTGTDFELCFTPEMKGDVSVGGRIVPLADLARDGRARPAPFLPGAFSVPFVDGTRARIDFGDASILLRPVPAPVRSPVPFRLDGQLVGFTGGVTVMVLMLLGLVFSVPADAKSLSLENSMEVQRFARFLIKPPEEKVEPLPAWLQAKAPDPGGHGKAHKGPPGKMGTPKSKSATGLYQLKGPKNNPNPTLAHDYAQQAARNAGVLGILRNNGGPFSSAFSTSETAIGTDATTVLGGLTGAEVGEANGVPGGLGLVGHEKGGDWGDGMNTVGLGRIGTIGIGPGSGPGKHGPALRDHKIGTHEPPITVGIAQVLGGMDKDTIRRVIRQHMNEVKFCYDQGLMRNADLFGRIIIQFTINGNGQVVSSMVQSSTMKEAQVEQCVAGTLRRFEFPKPQGGGVVMVSYPFAFNRPGESQ